MVNKYSFQNYKPKEMANVIGKSLPISVKTANEIAAFIKGKKIDSVIAYLENVIEKKQAIPYRRFVKDIPHRKGMRTGRFPRKASLYVIRLLKSLKANAKDKGLDERKLIVVHAASNRGSILFHTGRRRLMRKNSHFEIIAQQVEEKEKKKKTEVKQ